MLASASARGTDTKAVLRELHRQIDELSGRVSNGDGAGPMSRDDATPRQGVAGGYGVSPRKGGGAAAGAAPPNKPGRTGLQGRVAALVQQLTHQYHSLYHHNQQQPAPKSGRPTELMIHAQQQNLAPQQHLQQQPKPSGITSWWREQQQQQQQQQQQPVLPPAPAPSNKSWRAAIFERHAAESTTSSAAAAAAAAAAAVSSARPTVRGKEHVPAKVQEIVQRYSSKPIYTTAALEEALAALYTEKVRGWNKSAGTGQNLVKPGQNVYKDYRCSRLPNLT